MFNRYINYKWAIYVKLPEGILCGLHIGTLFRHADLNISHASKNAPFSSLERLLLPIAFMVNFLAACEIVESRNFPQAVGKSTIYIYICLLCFGLLTWQR
jgi:fucose 4-O-acetylase-like acetyltransferase